MNTLMPAPATEENRITTLFANKADNKIMAKRALLVGGTAVTVVVALPILYAAVHAGLALVALGGLAGAAYFVKQRVPYWIVKGENRVKELMQQEKNRHLTSMKNEAKQNPIEQAQNDYIRRSQQYDQFKIALEDIGGKVAAFKSKIDRTAREKPNFDLTQERAALQKMDDFYQNRKVRLGEAKQKLIQFKDKIEEAQTRWDFQVSANAAISAMNATDKDSKMSEILTEVAFTSVQEEFDSVFARLDVDAVEISSTEALDFGGTKLDVSTINIGTK